MRYKIPILIISSILIVGLMIGRIYFTTYSGSNTNTIDNNNNSVSENTNSNNNSNSTVEDNTSNDSSDNSNSKSNSSTKKNSTTSNSSKKSSSTTKNNTTSSNSKSNNSSSKSSTSTTTVPTTIKVNSITLSAKPNDSIAIGYNIQLSASISPSNATNKSISWTSSNPNVASVDGNGLVTGKNVGNAVITASADGASATYNVNVRNYLRVLMVGNSKTYINTIPLLVTNFAHADSIHFVHDTNYSLISGDSYIPLYFTKDDGADGSSLSKTFDNMNSQIVGNNKSWDIVIMQERTNQYYGKTNGYSDGVNKIVNKLYSINPYTQFYLRKTWVFTDSSTTDITNGYKLTDSVISSIRSSYPGININFINDGPLMYKAQDTGITVFQDERHQNKHGAYLAAACIYMTVFNKSSLTYSSGLSKEDQMKTLVTTYCYNHRNTDYSNSKY